MAHTAKTRDGYFNRAIEREKLERDEDHIVCPYCGWENDEPEDEYDFITYHGEGWGEFECPTCGETFDVEERVTRTFCTRQKICDELDQRDRAGWALSKFGGDLELASAYIGLTLDEIKAIVKKHNIDWEEYYSGEGK